jgi:transmembrane sensor
MTMSWEMSTERTQEIEDAASDWLIRRDSGAWTHEDQACFEDWLAGSTLHRVAFLRLERTWEDAARLKALGAGVRDELPPPRGRWNLSPFFESRDQAVEPEHGEPTLVAETREDNDDPEDTLLDGETLNAGVSEPIRAPATGEARSRRPFRIGTLSLAASLLLAVGVGAYVWVVPEGGRYATPIGGVASVAMTDGSRVTLNTDTEIRVSLTLTERRVDLRRGEAFFEVAKDPKRPFVVSAGGKRVIAVGTQFSVRRDAEDVEVVVTEGKVRVEDAGETVLTPGSIAHAGDAGVLVQRKTIPEAQEHLSWRTGVLMFRDETLGEAVAEFNRYNVRQIVIADPKVADLRIEGNFRATNVDAFVRLLESGFPVHAHTEDNRVLLTSN